MVQDAASLWGLFLCPSCVCCPLCVGCSEEVQKGSSHVPCSLGLSVSQKWFCGEAILLHCRKAVALNSLYRILKCFPQRPGEGLQKVKTFRHDNVVPQRAEETPKFPSKHWCTPRIYHQFWKSKYLSLCPAMRVFILILPLEPRGSWKVGLVLGLQDGMSKASSLYNILREL